MLTSAAMPSLIVCEKPSVAQDVAKALLGSSAKKTGDRWEGPDAIVAHAVGHLVEQVDPDAYDAKFKKWRYEDLPILPDSFRYQARDPRAAKQLKALHRSWRARTWTSSSTPATPGGRASSSSSSSSRRRPRRHGPSR